MNFISRCLVFSTLIVLFLAVPQGLEAQATVTLSSSPNPSNFGAPVTLAATLSPTTATGRVTFYDGVSVLGTKAVNSGTASMSTILLPAGSRKLTALYIGGTSPASTSNVVTQTVRALPGASFTPKPLAPPLTSNLVAVADFNGDGRADIAYPSANPDTNPWWQVDLGTSTTISSIVIWNRTDCCASRLSDYWIFFSETPFLPTDTPAILQNRTRTSFTHQTATPNPSTTIPANPVTGRYLRIQQNNSNPLNLAEVQVFGTGSQVTTNLALHKSVAQSSTLPGVAAAGPAAAVDGNTDGNFANGSVTSTSINFITVLFGNGDGNFASPVNVAISSDPSAMAVGDFNGDGITDLAAATFVAGSATPGNATVDVLLSKGDKSFGPPLISPSGLPAAIKGLAVADFNGDGLPDLVATYATRIAGAGLASGANLLVGKGDGSFGPALIYTNLGSAPLLVADFDGDGKPDLVLGTAPDAVGNFVVNPQIVLGNGDGTAQAPISLSVGAAALASNVATGDFNGDGKPDLAIGGFQFVNGAYMGTTWVFLAKGGGSFQAPVSYTTGSLVATADFNGDGFIDLLVSDTTGNTSILLGRQNGTFLPGPTVATESPLAVADFTSDGRADVLASDSILTGQGGAGAAFNLTATSGTPQFAAVGKAFALPLQVTLTDPFGVPIAGSAVTFTGPPGGAGATLSNAQPLTNSSGVATVTATANGTAGTYTITAFVSGLSATFTLTNVVAGSTNLAQGKTATQSSTLTGYPAAVAGSAVDGITDGNFFHGSVSSTNQESDAWWQVDLGASTPIASVMISNRTDCCASRLNDFWVFISDTPFLSTDTALTLQGRPGTFSNHQTAAPNPSVTIPTANAQGRYIRVQLSGSNYLSLAEVQVTAGGLPATGNLALGKAATQSSTFPGAPSAGAAVDGITDGGFFNGSVTATNADPAPWWQVDLGASASIGSIVIFNRTDCCSSRLNDFWVFVSDTPFLPTDTPATLQSRAGTFSSHLTDAPNPSTTIQVNQQGRYVRVQLAVSNYLSLAEVLVIASGTPPVSNVAKGKTATQSSSYPGIPSAAASSAVDGNTDGAFYNGSVTATNIDPSPWWQVDLGAPATISSIVIWNRTDCCASRLNDYWVFISNTPFLDTDTPATLQSRAATVAIHRTTAPNPSTTITVPVSARYVRVQLTTPNYLSLAEVEVNGQ